MRGIVIVAAGKSTRFGKNKTEIQLFDSTVLEKAIALFDGLADETVVVCNKPLSFVTTVCGGETRSKSVQNGLRAISGKCDVVAIHDAARPFVSRKLIEKLFREAEKFGSAVPYLPVSDTIWCSKEGFSPQNRKDFFTVQTPQIFDRKKLLAAFSDSVDYTDESTLFFNAYGDIHFVEGEYSNKKITVPADLPEYRIGVGFDVHAFEIGDGVILGGVKVPFDKKLVGHSDADVLTHAICDAVLSASGNRDIGVQFPDNDDRFLGISSLLLLKQCVSLAQKSGFCVENVSAVVICQAPKLASFIDEMSRNIAHILKISSKCVNISATTTEHLGALGNGDGIAAQAQALLSQKA